MGRGRISNEEKQKRLQQESIDKFGCVLKSISATEKVALEERKSKAITLLQELPNETICEIVNHFEERLKTGESENKE